MQQVTATDADDRGRLARRTARAAVWNVANFAIGRGIMLATTIATARLLEPEDFGLLGLAVTITTFLDLLNEFGLTTAYVYFTRRGDDERISNTAFTLNMLIGVALTLLTLAISPAVAAFYDEPRVLPILAVLSSSYLLVSVGAIHDGRLRARLDFRGRFKAEISRAVIKGVVTIGLAVAGFGVWSLVFGQVLGTAASSLVFLWVERWRPRLRLDREVVGRLSRYGSHLVVLGFIGMAASNVDYMFIGRRLGTEALGFYALAFRLPSLAIKGTSSVVGQVAFAAYAKLSDDVAGLRRAVLVSLGVLATYTVPVSFGMAVVAPDLVVVLFGERWETTGDLLRILAIHSLLTSVMFSAGEAYKATGRPGLLTVHAAVKLAAAIPLIWIAAGYDVETVAWAQVGVGAVSVSTQLILMHRVLDISPLTVMRTLIGPLASGVLMGVAAYAVSDQLGDVDEVVRLTLTGIAGLVVYGGSIWMLDRTGARRIIDLVRPARSAKEMIP